MRFDLYYTIPTQTLYHGLITNFLGHDTPATPGLQPLFPTQRLYMPTEPLSHWQGSVYSWDLIADCQEPLKMAVQITHWHLIWHFFTGEWRYSEKSRAGTLWISVTQWRDRQRGYYQQQYLDTSPDRNTLLVLICRHCVCPSEALGWHLRGQRVGTVGRSVPGKRATAHCTNHHLAY